MNDKTKKILRSLIDSRILCTIVFLIGGIWLLKKDTDLDEIRGVCCLLASLVCLTNLKIDTAIKELKEGKNDE